jgi:purine-binding chemotaxis protein CheW
MPDIVIFYIDKQELAIDLWKVKRIIWAVEVTAVPETVKNLMGMINLEGEVIPLINSRRVLGLKEREIELSDQFIICMIANKTLALWADDVRGVESYSKEDLIPAKDFFVEAEADYVLKREDKIIPLYNWEHFIGSGGNS